MSDVVCPYCLHNQRTRSKLKRVTCSSCGRKFLNKSNIINIPKEKIKLPKLPKLPKLKQIKLKLD